MSIFAKQCPACASSFIPWGVWRITRWSCMRCPACNTPLNRTLTLATWVAWLSVGISLNQVLRWPGLSVLGEAFFMLLGLAALYLTDLAIVRLAQPKSHHRFLGYKV